MEYKMLQSFVTNFILVKNYKQATLNILQYLPLHCFPEDLNTHYRETIQEFRVDDRNTS